MVTMVLKQTSPSDARFNFPTDTDSSEGIFSNITPILKEKINSLLIAVTPFFTSEPWSYAKNDTAEAILSTNLLTFDDYIDIIDSPTMPPKKEFQVKLIVRSIQRGKPSICDDYEIW
jgi:hypothetical protein